MKLNRIPNTTTDTGSMIIEFLYNNPEYKIKYMPFSSGTEYIPEIYYFEFFWNFKIIHFGSGSLWGGSISICSNYSYLEIFNKFCDISENGLTIEDKIKIEEMYQNKWYPFHKKFTGYLCSKNDLIKYDMDVI